MRVEEAHQALDQDLADYLEGKGVRPSCKAGCFACCFGWVTLSRLEGEALLPHLTEAQKARLLEEGPRRLALLAWGKDQKDFPSRFFRSRTPCPLLEGGLCGVYPHRPLACRGLLTEGDPAFCAPEAKPPQGHFLPVPWRMARLRMEALWEEERARYGFLLLGELAGLLYLLLRGLPEGREAVEALLEDLGVLGGRWGFQVV
ncbi:Putative zinc-or iron-chelating domain-containing protein [Thermus arciformis]|uniref:Putative zinc-or iron-chelating domain-containing protein n=1 Tax=Thermus arciformis TaxID=482827 RepID=A0A1G7ES58_9DEIN|nr:YkgJ family cysteine cluster protein [Thermus arciformis]SDE66457.1 Putative zinc-or iron-chelating domain-containing protein [Thermus arciformis]